MNQKRQVQEMASSASGKGILLTDDAYSPEKRDIRLIGLDLDGTTLTTDKELTPHTKALLEHCLAMGIQVLPATGRTRIAIPDYLKEIKGLRYMILSNGASLYDLQEDREIYSNCISWERAREFMDYLEQFDTYYDFYAQGRGFSEARFYDHIDEYYIEPHIARLVRESRTRIEDMRLWIQENKAPVEKFSLFFSSLDHKKEVWDILAQVEDMVPTSSVINNIEINHHTCTKGNALLALGKNLGYEPSRIMACGDGINDLSMIEAAGTGVAMANGHSLVKEAADYITRTNDEEGVAYAIERLCCISPCISSS